MFRNLMISAALALCAGTVASAQDRLALVLGNGDYHTVRPLDTATADAGLIARRLEDLGFQVTVALDTNLPTMTRAISDFGKTLRATDPDSTAMFYFSGHGLNSMGVNYLLPVDADIADPADLDFVAVDTRAVLNQMRSGANSVSIAVFDCCGFNPYPDIATLEASGLTAITAETGQAIAFATAPGTVLTTGRGVNGPYALALAESMGVQDATLAQVFENVAQTVAAQSGNAQTPWSDVGATADFVFNPAPELTPEQIAEMESWAALGGTADPLALMSFIQTYPEGGYVQDAKRRLAELLIADLDRQSDTTAPREMADTAARAPKEAPASAGGITMVPATAMSQEDMLDRARSTGKAADYRAYLDAYPQGVYAELVHAELAVIEAKGEASAPASQRLPQVDTAALVVAAAASKSTSVVQSSYNPDPELVAFEAPIVEGAPEITGKTIAQLIKGSPLFPPVEDLPESYWKTESCSNCHQWTKADLCTQANFYRTAAGERNMGKQHPLGGSFKRNLRAWAEGGCK